MMAWGLLSIFICYLLGKSFGGMHEEGDGMFAGAVTGGAGARSRRK
jgi:hypothetical protein